MENLIFFLVLYLAVINLITFFLFWKDKRRSKRDDWRIPEKTLIGLCVFGGSIGGMLGMQIFHHKTKHWQFSMGIPVIFILQLGISVFIALKIF